MRIGIDIDGVLANFNKAFAERLVKVTGRNLLPDPVEFPLWNWPQHYGYTEAEVSCPTGTVWQDIHKDPEFWYTLEAYDGAQEFLRKLDIGWHDIYFITSRGGQNVKMQTEAWLEYNGFGLHTPNFGFPTVLISSEKGLAAKALNLDLYIDDKTENVLDVNHASPKTLVVQLTQPWNAHDYHVVRKVDSLDEFSKFITPYGEEVKP